MLKRVESFERLTITHYLLENNKTVEIQEIPCFFSGPVMVFNHKVKNKNNYYIKWSLS